MSALTEHPPLKPDPVSMAQVSISNALAGRCRKLDFDWDGRPASLTFQAATGDHAISRRVTFRLDGQEYELGLTSLPEISWISPELAGVSLDSLPHELAVGVLQVCVELISTAVLDKSRKFEILEVGYFGQDREMAGEVSVGWTVSRGDESRWLAGIVSCSEAAGRHLVKLFSKVPARRNGSTDSLMVPLDVIIGQMTWTLAGLMRLKTGDVILGEFEPFMDDGSCSLQVGDARVGRGRAEDDGGLEIQSINLDASNDSPMLLEDGDVRTPADCPSVILSFRVGREVLPVSRLKALAQGDVLQDVLPARRGSVTVVCGGKTVADGELIRIGARTGVRLTRLAGQ